MNLIVKLIGCFRIDITVKYLVRYLSDFMSEIAQVFSLKKYFSAFCN